MTNSTTRIVVGLSGGVDSSVTASLLKQQGYDLLGVFMQNWEDDNDDAFCSIKEDSRDAIAVADIVGIDIELVNFATEYKDRVFAYFLAEYQVGRTPNPDVLCNAEIKFKAFLDYALSMGASKIATGHYARTDIGPDGKTRLLRGLDESKDQSYFLYRLSQYQVSHALFPLGELKKTEVRRLAEEAGLPNHAKKDSTGICFIGERPFRDFLNRYLPKEPGQMLTPEGKRVGEHMGLMYYTLGQRQGLNIGGPGEPWYVAGKNMEKNELIVVQGHDHPQLLKNSLTADQLSWVADTAPPLGRYTAKTRYRQADASCELISIMDGIAHVHFTEPQWAVTPGQSVVLYEGPVCLGGGIII
ncbi:tRNA 2-thiouridine(34) synthase MnmA [Chitinimonas sp. BJB300]|uniref:tRNA 2-thiouridine(34) synthase MnmA n=1 Tax=Chitinimonas sp. BJB300 TaxID=1559339 RepID=UPI000C0D95E1|nr:tRNA 2-thiouridine(34) synthase MnmA [Chitinimonas sp. BJB300]PHV12263.1 tRNA 2-thiouridine(34) synthase MnmA [Chitinimonas sp. BJB300]TSJ84775.1 tRNA 2-thiouridine(34) synthase MnmA [Chitinimonas sp. BJB300]